MKAEELRVGNLVDRLYESGSVTDGVYQYTIGTETFCSNNEFGEPLFTDLYPIPLTEEWLLKFGFEYNKVSDLPHCRYIIYKLNGDIVSREKDSNEWNYNLADCDECGRYIEIKYIHQLQNLYFALTGEELTIKI